MKVLLVSYDNDNSIAYFPLGLGYLASAIRSAGHEVVIYQQDVYHYPQSHLTNYLNENDFDVVGLGACGGYFQYGVMKKNLKAINQLRNKPTIILGGHLPSPEPEFFLRKFAVDFIVIGEGEETIVELLNTIQVSNGDYNNINGIAYLDVNDRLIVTERRKVIKNVDEIPFPAYDLFNMEQYVIFPDVNMKRKDRSMVMISGRGCPFKCNFCYRLDEGFRPRSTKSLIDEINYLMIEFRITYISFWDDLLMSSISRMKEFCESLINNKIAINWSCNGRLNYASKRS